MQEKRKGGLNPLNCRREGGNTLEKQGVFGRFQKIHVKMHGISSVKSDSVFSVAILPVSPSISISRFLPSSCFSISRSRCQATTSRWSVANGFSPQIPGVLFHRRSHALPRDGKSSFQFRLEPTGLILILVAVRVDNQFQSVHIANVQRQRTVQMVPNRH